MARAGSTNYRPSSGPSVPIPPSQLVKRHLPSSTGLKLSSPQRSSMGPQGSLPSLRTIKRISSKMICSSSTGRRRAALRAAKYQQDLRRYHSRHIRPRTLETGDLVLRRILSREGLHKLSPMWEGPYRVAHIARPGAVRLETEDGIPVKNPWNIAHLRKFYS